MAMVCFRRHHAVAALAAFALAACAPAPKPFPELPRLGVDMHFEATNLCSLGVSPAIRVVNPPRGTRAYTIRMTNMDVLFQTPWEGTVEARGGEIPAGAATPYTAPCPGQFQRFSYRVEVLAKGDAQRPLAHGQTFAIALSTDRMLGPRIGAQRTLPVPGPGPGAPQGAGRTPEELPVPEDAFPLPYSDKSMSPELVPTYPR